MKKYWHVLNIGIQNNLTYRFNFLARTLFGLVPLMAMLLLWRTIYSAKGGDATVSTYTLAQMISYYLIMTVVDASLPNKCDSPDNHCKTPWDFCCAAPEELLPNLATVKFTDPDGRTLAVDLTSDGRINPNATLVVRGVVGARPSDEVLEIRATGIFVESAGE